MFTSMCYCSPGPKSATRASSLAELAFPPEPRKYRSMHTILNLSLSGVARQQTMSNLARNFSKSRAIKFGSRLVTCKKFVNVNATKTVFLSDKNVSV